MRWEMEGPEVPLDLRARRLASLTRLFPESEAPVIRTGETTSKVSLSSEAPKLEFRRERRFGMPDVLEIPLGPLRSMPSYRNQLFAALEEVSLEDEKGEGEGVADSLVHTLLDFPPFRANPEDARFLFSKDTSRVGVD